MWSAETWMILEVNELHSSTYRVLIFHFGAKLRNKLVLLTTRHYWILHNKLANLTLHSKQGIRYFFVCLVHTWKLKFVIDYSFWGPSTPARSNDELTYLTQMSREEIMNSCDEFLINGSAKTEFSIVIFPILSSWSESCKWLKIGNVKI